MINIIKQITLSLVILLSLTTGLTVAVTTVVKNLRLDLFSRATNQLLQSLTIIQGVLFLLALLVNIMLSFNTIANNSEK